MCTCRLIDTLFEDKRLAVVFLITWMILVITLFKELGLLEAHFVSFGPSSHTTFMGVVLDSWYKWGLVAGFTFANTVVNDFMSDAISPWILNTITDHKTRYIPYRKSVCLLISQSWSIYCNVMGVLSLFLSMTQIDFVLIRMGADLFVNCYTNLKFMANKTHDPAKYKKATEFSHAEPQQTQDTDVELQDCSASDPLVAVCDKCKTQQE